MSAPAAPQSTADLLHRLDHWTASGALRELDRAFVRFLAAEAPDAPPLLLLAAALASHQLGRGHVCLDLAATLADSHDAPDPTAAERPESALAGLSLARWLDALADPRLVGSGAGDTPLVREGNRLYLRRYWQHEHAVRTALRARLAQTRALREALPATALRAALDALFAPAGERTDWQKIACALCAGSAFSLITGGPGTGKTTTVVRLLALLQSLALETGGPGRALRIRLAAPTGKAAARLSASIAGALAKLADLALPHGEAARAAVPSEVTTLHRLLGSRPDSRHFRHDASHPLALDVLVVDEASMIDLELMSALLAALPAHARLVLLGDKDQLASVEAGAVLGELCARAEDGHYLPATAAWLQEASG
ncbi:MAG: exodeoxyribonuclease V subunit alpha, partial [Candidatus Dactylopiibacterium sp.]|nr:exodeoxyribonuclease V subunit alpha [Candidatus Dactylopiibacterium sp.]